MTTSILLSGRTSSRAQPSRLQRLQPVAPHLEQSTERPPESLRALQHIHTVEITHTSHHREGRPHKAFVIDVYYKQSQRHHIPVVSSRIASSRPSGSTTSSTRAPPDVQVQRTFREIRRLRDAAYYAANADHGIMPCAYCPALFEFILVHSTAPSTIAQWLQKEEKTCASLTTFLQQLLRLAVQVETTGQESRSCHGKRCIPELLAEFLQLLTPPRIHPRELGSPSQNVAVGENPTSELSLQVMSEPTLITHIG